MTNNTFDIQAIVPVNNDQLDAVSHATFYNPHEILGGHLGSGQYEGTCTIRVLRPKAQSVTIVTKDGETQSQPEHNGVFVAVVPAVKTDNGYSVPDYRIRTVAEDGTTRISWGL